LLAAPWMGKTASMLGGGGGEGGGTNKGNVSADSSHSRSRATCAEQP